MTRNALKGFSPGGEHPLKHKQLYGTPTGMERTSVCEAITIKTKCQHISTTPQSPHEPLEQELNLTENAGEFNIRQQLHWGDSERKRCKAKASTFEAVSDSQATFHFL